MKNRKKKIRTGWGKRKKERNMEEREKTVRKAKWQNKKNDIKNQKGGIKRKERKERMTNETTRHPHC